MSKDACIKSIASRDNNLELCSYLDNSVVKSGLNSKTNCVSSIALEKNDVNICSSLLKQEGKDISDYIACANTLARRNENKDLCSMYFKYNNEADVKLDPQELKDDIDFCLGK